MTTAVRELLASFEALGLPDRHEAAVEILRRAPLGELSDLPEDGLLDAADELFRQMDAEEAKNAAR